MPRSTFYRLVRPKEQVVRTARTGPVRKLNVEDRLAVLAVLHEDRFVDKAPAQVFASLLDDGIYLCSISTMYRILREHDEVRERRKVLRHKHYTKPELLATGPNQVWSWDITKLKGPEKWTYSYLYVIIDIYSRYTVGWMVASKESAALAEALIRETCLRQNVDTEKLIIHSDRGAAMTSKLVAHLLADLGVTKSLNRPYVSNDNPYSESQFKTLKYQPTFPSRFGSLQDARAFCKEFFNWYNNHHYHSGIALMTPSVVHHGLAAKCNQKRQGVLLTAFKKNPERFVKGYPKTLELPAAAWINKPQPATNQKSLPASENVCSNFIPALH